jgi:hypothetical protein
MLFLSTLPRSQRLLSQLYLRLLANESVAGRASITIDAPVLRLEAPRTPEALLGLPEEARSD